MTHTTRTHRPWWLAAAVAGTLIASVLLLACSSSDETDDTETPPSATDASPSTTADRTPQVSGDVITQEDVLKKDPGVTKHVELKWGAMFEQSGPLAGFGEPSADGIKLAVKEINDAGGFQVGDTIYTINLLERDTKSTTQDALAVATELVRDEKLKIIWGPATAGDPEATAITQREGVLHICPCPQRELTALSSQEKADQNKWAFQTLAAPSKFLPGGAANNRREHPDYTSFATICVNSQTGHAFCDFFADAYADVGLEHVGEVFFPDGTTDFRPFLTTLMSKNPDIILNFTDAGVDQFALIRDSVALDVGKFYIAVALNYELFESLVGGPAIRTKYVGAGAAPRNNAIYTSEKARVFFDEKYKSFKGGTLPFAAFAAMLTYDPAFMLIAAMQKAGTVDDTTAIAEALGEIHYSGYGEDNIYFDSRNIIVTGNDGCTLFGGNMTCQHFPPPQQ